MKRLLLLACALLPISLFAGGGLPNQPYIYIEGVAEIERMADMVTLRFTLSGRSTEQTKANQEVQVKAGKILGLLNDRKVAQTDVIAEELRSQPQFENDEAPEGKRGKIIGYWVVRDFDVKVRDVSIFAKLVDDLIAVGGAEFTAIDGGLSNEQELKQHAWDKAVANARERAEKTVALAGMKIDSVFAISPIPFPQIEQKMLEGSERYRPGGTAETQRAIESDPLAYRLAALSVTQNVHVIYLISPAK